MTTTPTIPASTPDCLRCQTPMEDGFIAERGRNSLLVPRWCRGEPQRSFLAGELGRRQYTDGLRIHAYRCPNCGYLESYAPILEGALK